MISDKVRKTRGDFGESAVCEHLRARGYEIVARNYRKNVGEIDIIAVVDGQLVFVEVKTRKFGSMTDGADSVTFAKRRKIAKTARAFIAEHPDFREMNARFDVVSVVVTTDNVPRLLEIEHYEDAFDAAFS
jgi:putative endonuclease